MPGWRRFHGEPGRLLANDHPPASEVLAEKPGLFIYEIVQRRVSEPPQPLVSP